MQFNSFSDFINMGGYGFYVWLSFGAAALILTLLLISSKADHQKIITQIAKRKQREDKLRQAKALRKQQNKELNEVIE
ncbi:heme exporter protein CcmD [Colwellia psychrerythraea]|uniref:Heme exporter protein D n=1 Tax=Colwellia psychrerythraea (strain 34H / ATCC BAA-681) TaxID=167879 RepID=Q487I5_COLP3|nr:heme exporter protein CcmD [Colwellia psychrerythraea]AAZ23971.1 heme exporter protein CcmD [Colwellia psychrerythraea 34H]